MSSIFGEESVQTEVKGTEFKVRPLFSDPSLVPGLGTEKLYRDLKRGRKTLVHPIWRENFS